VLLVVVDNKIELLDAREQALALREAELEKDIYDKEMQLKTQQEDQLRFDMGLRRVQVVCAHLELLIRLCW